MSKLQCDNDLDFGPVLVTRGVHRGRVMYYDDDELSIAICYAGHPIDFVECYGVRRTSIRVPTIDELIVRRDAIYQQLTRFIQPRRRRPESDQVHSLWSEKSLIDNELFRRRRLGELGQIDSDRTLFLCHSSADKGVVRMINDDLRRLGFDTWLDENKIKVGDSIIGKMWDGLKESPYMAVFLSPDSVKSLWARREWQSFLARQLDGHKIKVLPVLLKECPVPEIISDLKYANFTRSYQDGLEELLQALQ